MKRNAFILLIMAVAAISACTKPEKDFDDELLNPTSKTYTYTITATNGNPETKSDYGTDGSFKWSAGDAISVLFHNGTTNKFFTLTTNDSGSNTATFSGEIETGYTIGASDGTTDDMKIWALFPASDNHTYTEGSNPYFYVQPSVDFTTSHFSANIPMYALNEAEGAMTFKNLTCAYKFTVTGIKSGVSKVQFTVSNASGLRDLSGSSEIKKDSHDYYINYGWTRNSLTLISNVTDNQAVFYVPCRYYAEFQPTITVMNYSTGVAIKTFTASTAKTPTSMKKVQPITLNVSDGDYYTPAITIDGDLSDWAGISDSYNDSSKTRIRIWKIKSDDHMVFFYIAMRKNRAWNSNPGLYIGFDTDNDSSTGNSYGNVTGCEAYVKVVPFSNNTEGSEPVGFTGIDANSEVWASGIGYHNGTVSVAHYDAGESLSSSSSNTYLEIGINREYLGLPASGNSVSIGCSFEWYALDKTTVTLE